MSELGEVFDAIREERRSEAARRFPEWVQQLQSAGLIVDGDEDGCDVHNPDLDRMALWYPIRGSFVLRGESFGERGHGVPDLIRAMTLDPLPARTMKRPPTVHSQNEVKALAASGLTVTIHNGGHHLVVTDSKKTIDFWPSTGTWHARPQPGKKGTDGLKGVLRRFGRKA